MIMRTFLFTLAILSLASCSTPTATKENAEQPAPPVPAPIIGPFQDLPLRYDGYYRNDVGQVIYLIRFFPEGRVVLINGTKEVEAELPKFLVRETHDNPGMGLYNVMVDVRGDSLFFMTRPEKGEISYSGSVVDGSLVRFLRHSHITGSKQVMEYIFYPDPTIGPEPEPASK